MTPVLVLSGELLGAVVGKICDEMIPNFMRLSFTTSELPVLSDELWGAVVRKVCDEIIPNIMGLSFTSFSSFRRILRSRSRKNMGRNYAKLHVV